jgi:hypothetical protein
MMWSLFASRIRKNKARLIISYPSIPAFTGANIGIETISSSIMLLPEELLLCPLNTKWLIDIMLNKLDKAKVLESTH